MASISGLLQPDILGAVNSGFDRGQDQRKNSILAQYAQSAVGGDQNALSQIYQSDPTAGLKLQQQSTAMGEQQKSIGDKDLARLGQHARLVTALADAGDTEGAANLYKTIYPEASKILGPNLPSTFDPSMVEHMRQIANAADPQTKKDLINLTPGSTLIDPGTGKPVYSQPAAAPNLVPLQTDQGYSTFNPKTGSFAPSYYGGGGSQQTSSDPMADLVSAPGGQRVMPRPRATGSGGGQGKPPVGYRWSADGTSQEVIPGGPADKAGKSNVPGDATVTGNDYLSSLGDPQIAAQVKALAEGRMAFPTGTALKDAHWQQMLGAISQYDPTFDQVNYNARSGTRKAFTSGKEASTVNSLNTVAEHLGTLSDSAQKLNNTSFRPYNALKNKVADTFGDADISDFETRRKAAADEVAKVWRASGGSQADIEENLQNLSESKSPDQMNAAIGALTQLIAGKVAALNDQYKSGMGTSAQNRPLVSPEARKAFQKTLDRAGMQDEHGLVGSGGSKPMGAPGGQSSMSLEDALSKYQDGK